MLNIKYEEDIYTVFLYNCKLDDYSEKDPKGIMSGTCEMKMLMHSGYLDRIIFDEKFISWDAIEVDTKDFPAIFVGEIIKEF